jgi:hypothetical protein
MDKTTQVGSMIGGETADGEEFTAILSAPIIKMGDYMNAVLHVVGGIVDIGDDVVAGPGDELLFEQFAAGWRPISGGSYYSLSVVIPFTGINNPGSFPLHD